VIVLDTNIVSPLMREPADARIREWLNTVPYDDVYTSAVTVFEIRLGLGVMPDGKRRAGMLERFEGLLKRGLSERVLPLDLDGASRAATVLAQRMRQGTPIEYRDAMIAGTALAHNAVLATANTRHFQGMGLELVNPLTVS
jgi:toxin FitB